MTRYAAGFTNRVPKGDAEVMSAIEADRGKVVWRTQGRVDGDTVDAPMNRAWTPVHPQGTTSYPNASMRS